MPCVDGRDHQHQGPSESAKLSAALCGILRELERTGSYSLIMGSVDWKRAGISKKWLNRWWYEHKNADGKK